MKNRLRQILIILSAALLVAAILSGCSRPATKGAADSGVDYYTCTMHPSVKSKDPGKCPICAMDLVPVKKGESQGSGGSAAGPVNHSHTGHSMAGGQPAGSTGASVGSSAAENKPTEFSVPIARQQQIGVTYAAVENRPLQFSIRSVGMLEPDAGKAFDYTARVDGYIQDLTVTSPGERVTEGQPLMTIYSPDLRSTEQELANLLNERDRGTAARPSTDPLIEAARRRLRLWNVSDREISELEKTRQPSERLVLRSPFDGVIQDVPMRRGASVKVGDRLVQVLDLSRLWLWAEFYENEIEFLREGQPIEMTIAAFPNQVFAGRISAINPMVDVTKRTTRVRIDVPNAKGLLRPGMFANVEIQVDQGRGLAIPYNAVLPTGSRYLVFIDKGSGKLEPRFIQVGRSFSSMENDRLVTYYRIVSGLAEGERVVASANFLIDAESKIQGAVKNWEEEPAPRRGEREQSAATHSPELGAEPPKVSTNDEPAVAGLKSMLDAYLRIQQRMVQDQFDGVAAAAEKMRHELPELKTRLAPELFAKLETSIRGFRPTSLEETRIQFGHVSAELLTALQTVQPPGGQKLYAMRCPMWKKSPGVWIQEASKVANPFMGQAMIECGSIEAALGDDR
jgi:membrane fusion protein, copper/silver efflux system